jgi:hypothetical protein
LFALAEPDYPNAKNNAAFFKRVIKNKEVKAQTMKERPPYMDTYSSLCRGECNKVGNILDRDTGQVGREFPLLPFL